MITGNNGLFSYSQAEIDRMTTYLQDCARRRDLVHYDDAYMKVRDFGGYSGPHDKRLWDLLGIVSAEEVKQGRGALSAIVVTKENNRPGVGFFELERDLGRYSMDDDTTWIAEVNWLHTYWPQH